MDGGMDKRMDGWTETCMPKSPMLKQVQQKYRWGKVNNVKKVTKINLKNYIQTTFTSTDPGENMCKVSKR